MGRGVGAETSAKGAGRRAGADGAGGEGGPLHTGS